MIFCTHQRMSWPITTRLPRPRHIAPAPGPTYQVCLDCGIEREFTAWVDGSVPEAHVAAEPRGFRFWNAWGWLTK